MLSRKRERRMANRNGMGKTMSNYFKNDNYKVNSR